MGEELYQRTQDELKKVLAMRRDARGLQDTATLNAKEISKLAQRLHDLQRRCSSLVDQERLHRQTLQEERAQWEQERSRFELQNKKLRAELLRLKQSRQQTVSTVDALEPTASASPTASPEPRHCKPRARSREKAEATDSD